MTWRIRSPRMVLALLTALNLLNYLDRFVLSAVLAPVQDDLHLSKLVAGLLPTIFLIGYFATSPLFGVAGDRFGAAGRHVLIALGVAVWSLATLASGLAAGTVSMLVARAAVGVGEASYGTLAPTVIDEIAPPALESSWMAIFSVAISVGSALGYVVGGAVLHAHGWRSAFFVAGFPGLVAAVLCLFMDAPVRREVAERPRVNLLRAGLDLARVPLYRKAVLGCCPFVFAIGGFGYWAPFYVHDRYGMDPGSASVDFGLVTVAGGLVGTLLSAWVADAAVRREVRRAEAAHRAPLDDVQLDAAVARANLHVCAISAGIGAPLSAAALFAPTPTVFYAVLLPCEVALFLQFGPTNVAFLRSAPPALRASAMAFAIFAMHLLGDLWSTPLMGLLADRWSMQAAMCAVPLMFGVAALAWRGSGSASVGLT